jgi:hypothetical protein
VRKGRKFSMAVLNKPPNTNPTQAIIIPMLIVIQNGPITDRRYLLNISVQPNNNASWIVRALNNVYPLSKVKEASILSIWIICN